MKLDQLFLTMMPGTAVAVFPAFGQEDVEQKQEMSVQGCPRSMCCVSATSGSLRLHLPEREA
jgi:hypothetical protein